MGLEMTSEDLDNNMSKARKILTMGLIMSTIFLGSLCFSLQSPFYPAEAERKGVPPTQYGFVFGVFQLIVCLTSPIYGKYINVIGSTFMFKVGLFSAAWCTIIFGFLDESPGGNTFFGLSIVVRVVAAFGESAIYTSSYVIAARCCPQAMATAMALVETAFGAGSILGPTVGGVLYQVGGFKLPFVVMGGILMIACIISMIGIKEIVDVREKGGPKIGDVFRMPSVLVLCYAIFVSATCNGFISALLEPHLRIFNISPMYIGLIFMANGATYTLSAALWGRIADLAGNYRLLCIIGTVLFSIGILFLGPAPFIPLEKTVTLIVISLVISGFGMGNVLVCAVIGVLDEIISNGGPKSMATQGFVSGLYNALFAFGAFIGPTLGGPLFDSMGFAASSMVIFSLQLLSLVLFVGHELFQKRKREIKNMETTTPLLQPLKTVHDLSSLEWRLIREPAECRSVKAIM